MPYNIITKQWELDLPNIKGATNYFGNNLGNPSLSSSLVSRNNPLFQNKGFDINKAVAFSKSLDNFKFTMPSMKEAMSAALTADPVSSVAPVAAAPTGKGFFGSMKAKDLGKFGKANADLLGQLPEATDALLGFAGAEKANLSQGAANFDTAASGAFKVALKTGNPWAIAGTGLVAGLSKINMYAGKKIKGAGTGLIEMKGYTPEIETEGKLAVTGGGKKYQNIIKKNKGIVRGNLLKGAASYSDKQNQLAAQNTAQDISSQNQQKLAGGINPYLLSAKKGAKINPKKLSTIKKKAQYKVRKAQEGSEVDDGQKFALGGKINVIPEGALHARKNNYEGELAEQVTSKGIPVITYDEDDKITQHAEIEHSEIIFNKDVTNQLEEWFKKYNEYEKSVDKADLEIKCGKFLTEEILENTEDNVGLIEQT